MRKKITVIGAGNVGASCAIQLAQKELGDVVVMDIREGWAAGTTLDMFQYTPVAGVDAKVAGGSNYEATAGSVMANADRISPSSNGRSHRFCCSSVP